MPQNKNKFQQGLLKAKKLAVFALFLLLSWGGTVFLFDKMTVFAEGRSEMGLSEQQRYQGMIEALVNKLNREREKIGLQPLEIDRRLEQMAEYKLQNMAKDGYFAHISPSGQTAWDIFDKFGYEYSFAGENLATNFVDADDLHRAWMRSPEHRKNILFPEYTKVGLAIGETRTGALLAVEYFAKPLSAEEMKQTGQTNYVRDSIIGKTKTELGAGAFRDESQRVVRVIKEKESDRLINLNNLMFLLLELVALILVAGVWTLEKEDELFLKRVKKENCVL